MYDPNEKLSEHFAAWEIFGKRPATAPDRLRWFLAEKLCRDLLEPLRKVAKAPLRVTDGERSWYEHSFLVAQGKRPSPTSDHMFGPGFLDQVGARRPMSEEKWNFGMGAADTMPLRKVDGVWVSRKWTVGEFEDAASDARLRFGQLIWYPVRGHLHVSNPRGLLFTDEAIRGLDLPPKVAVMVYPESEGATT